MREAAISGAARRLPVEERAPYLDEVCAGDALLRRQIKELLKADESAGAFLAELAAGAGGPVRADAGLDPEATLGAAPGRSEQPGDTIDRYKLMENVGEGGFGVVYVAEQKDPGLPSDPACPPEGDHPSGHQAVEYPRHPPRWGAGA